MWVCPFCTMLFDCDGFCDFRVIFFAFSRRLAIVFAAAAAVQRVIVQLLYAMRVVRSFMAVIARFFSRFDYFTVGVFFCTAFRLCVAFELFCAISFLICLCQLEILAAACCCCLQLGQFHGRNSHWVFSSCMLFAMFLPLFQWFASVSRCFSMVLRWRMFEQQFH